MTKLAILSDKERALFDSPPKFNSADRLAHFALDQSIMNILQPLRTPTNKVGFMLQYGYFKAYRKFYTADQFRQQDINHIIQILNLEPKTLDLDKYQKAIPSNHRRKILLLFGWKPLNEKELNKLFQHIVSQVQNQILPRKLFDAAVDYCWNNKIEVPSYNQLALLITNAYNDYESSLVGKIKNSLNSKVKTRLNSLVKIKDDDVQYQRPLMTILKQVNQSLRPQMIKENIELFNTIKDYFYDLENVITDLSLSEQETEYYSTWVQKARITQLNQFIDKNKLYLYLIAFIKHQHFYRTDTLVEILIKAVQSARNHAIRLLMEAENSKRIKTNKAIKKVTRSNRDSRGLIEAIKDVIKSPALSIKGKYTQIEQLVDEYYDKYDKKSVQEVIKSEYSLEEISKNNNYFDILESLSLKLQHRVSNIVKSLDFNAATSDNAIIGAIEYFKAVDGNIGQDAPLDFLNQDEKEIIFKDDKIRVSLYKILLFISMVDAIKAGKLNLKYSYNYKSFEEYLIDINIWRAERQRLVKNAGLKDYINFNTVLNDFQKKLNHKYDEVNQNIISGKNKYVITDNDDVKVKTPNINSSDIEYISTLLSNVSYVPILQILTEINNISNFAEAFKHHSIKYTKMTPEINSIFAGILAKGCNIGIKKIANISKGISEGVLRNVVNWCFSLKNIQSANNKIIAIINKLSLPNVFKRLSKVSHTSSDGLKINVGVDSLNANFSFKYFGKGKGCTMYTFVDERSALFYSTVISASDREAAYVIDALLQNDVIKSDIHSTDTHGFTEVLFTAMNFIGTAFAPRFKQVTKQQLYSFQSRSSYKNKGYKILPSRTINVRLIAEHWDDILRFIATIKLKYATASTLFKRLSSYAKDHPLYRALKEFGRIIKSLFILTYYDDVGLRQSIQKQLNKVEQSNKFSKAIFFANSQEFQYGEKYAQEIDTACMVLIQNSIVLWNYLYLSQLLLNSNEEEQLQMISSMKSGSVATWRHVNLHGEYDFTKNAANDEQFDMNKILSLKVK